MNIDSFLTNYCLHDATINSFDISNNEIIMKVELCASCQNENSGITTDTVFMFQFLNILNYTGETCPKYDDEIIICKMIDNAVYIEFVSYDEGYGAVSFKHISFECNSVNVKEEEEEHE